MRRLTGIAALALIAGLVPESAADVGAGGGLESAAPEQQIYSIDRLDASCDSGVLTITGGATSSTPGWTKLHLAQTEATADTLTFKAMGTPPASATAQVLEHVHIASQINASKGIAHIHVVAGSNALDADVLPPC